MEIVQRKLSEEEVQLTIAQLHDIPDELVKRAKVERTVSRFGVYLKQIPAVLDQCQQCIEYLISTGEDELKAKLKVYTRAGWHWQWKPMAVLEQRTKYASEQGDHEMFLVPPERWFDYVQEHPLHTLPSPMPFIEFRSKVHQASSEDKRKKKVTLEKIALNAKYSVAACMEWAFGHMSIPDLEITDKIVRCARDYEFWKMATNESTKPTFVKMYLEDYANQSTTQGAVVLKKSWLEDDQRTQMKLITKFLKNKRLFIRTKEREEKLEGAIQAIDAEIAASADRTRDRAMRRRRKLEELRAARKKAKTAPPEPSP